MSLKIIGTGKSLPEKCISNSDLSGFLDTSDEWISTRTGIRTRYVCTDETITDLAERASLSAIRASGLDPGKIDLLLCSTVGGDFVTPSLAAVLQRRIGVSCPAMDLNAACSGFLYALDVAAAYLDAKRAKNILIVSAEMMSKYADWADRSTSVLFGDGAGACVVTGGSSLRYLRLITEGDADIIHLDGGLGNSPFSARRPRGYLQMAGRDVYRFAVNMVQQEAAAALASLRLSPGDVDFYLLHQANKRIIDAARIKLRQPEEKFPTNIERYGNMSSASVPILLDELVKDGVIRPGHTLFLSAFGAGLTAGSCVLVWE